MYIGKTHLRGERKMLKIKKTDYGNETLRTITKGISYTLVIHQEAWEEIKKLFETTIEKVSFLDEQGVRWQVTKVDNLLCFKAKGNKKIKINPDELL